MKKLTLLPLIVLCTLTYGQKLNVTPNGLRDAEDNEKTYVVINAEAITAKQLYDNAIKYINKNYKSPEDVIKSKIDGEYIKFDTHVSNFLFVLNSGVKVFIDADYTIELSFRDERVKFEVISLHMYNSHKYEVMFTGGVTEGFPIWDKKGKLRRPDTKTDIEFYFNDQITSLAKFLQGKNVDDW